MKIVGKKISPEITTLKVSPLADWHLSDPNCNEKLLRRFVDTVQADPNWYITLLGDLVNNALKNSRSDCYSARYSPAQERKEVVKLLYPVRDRILLGLDGNHEHRTQKDVGVDVSEYLYKDLDLEHLYCKNLGAVKIRMGREDHGLIYILAMAHGNGGGGQPGAALNRLVRYASTMEGIDVFCTAHTHQPLTHTIAKQVIDRNHGTVSYQPVKLGVTTGWLNYSESYAERMLLLPAGIAPLTFVLNGTKKEVTVLS